MKSVDTIAQVRHAFHVKDGRSSGFAANLHGHSHGKLKPLPRQRDVGVDAWDFRPVAVSTLLQDRPHRPS